MRRRAREFQADIPDPNRVAARSGGWLGVGRRTIDWLVTGFRRSRANDLAAGIAYYALLSIIPIIFGLISIVGVVLRTEEGYRQAAALVSAIVPDELAGESRQTLPRLRDESGAFGLASLVGFFWLGSTFFAALGRAMNQVYGVPDRPPLRQRLRSVVGVLAFAVLFTASVTLAVVPTVVLGIDEGALSLGLERWRLFRELFSGLYQLLSYGAASLAAILLFGLIFRLAPAAGQRVADIVPGAVVIGIIFVLFVQIFPAYLQIVRGWNLIGGTAGLLSLLLVWFYILGHMFLFGAYMNATWQRHRRAEANRSRQRGS